MAKLGDLVVRIGANTKDFNAKLGTLKSQIRKDTKNIAAMGRNLSMSVTAPLALIGASSFRTAADFEQSMAKVKAVSGATADEFAKLESNAKELGRTTRFTASEVSELQLNFAKLGFTAEEITQVTGATLALAQATGSDLATSAEIAGSTLRAFGLSADETSRVTDVMAKSFSTSALDMDTFADSMKYVAPVAKAAGLSVEETTAMLASLSNAGIKGSQAGTSLRRIISELGATGGDVAGAIKKLAGEGLNLADAKDEVGRSAQSALLVLANSTDQTAKLTTEFQNAKGAAQGMADIMDDTAEGAMKRMQSALEGAQIEIGSALAPIMIKLAGIVSDLASRFSSMSDGGQMLIMSVAGIAAAIGPILMILPNLIEGIKLARIAFTALNTTMLANPFFLAATAITAVVGAVALLYSNATDAEKEIAKLRDELNGLDKDEAVRVAAARIEVQKEAVEKQRMAVEALRKQVLVGDAVERRIHMQSIARHSEELAAMEKVLAGFEAVHAEVLASDPAINNLTKEVQDLGNNTKETTDKLKDKSNTLGFLINQLEEVPNTDIWKPVKESTDKANNSLGALFNTLEAVPSIDYDRETMTQMEKDFEDLNKSITDSINGAVNSAIIGFGMMLGEGIATGQGMKGVGAMLLGVFADLAIQLGTLAIGYGIAIENIKVALASLAGPVAIAAGVALVALGAGLKGAISKNAEQAGVPAFANGGIVSGPTMALVGEYPGAKTNPEVIAPLDKLRSMIGGNTVQVTGKISGRDILLTSERNAIDRNRVRGF
jgi:phage-related minor tail protein